MLTGWRERLLDKLTSTDPDRILNGDRIPARRSKIGIASELKIALDEIKADAFENDGASVDYQALRQSPAYRKFRTECSPQLRLFDPASLGSWQEKLAFWINLYNTLVLDAVIQFGVRQSVTESRFGIMAFFRRAAYEVNGWRSSANDIEHGILRLNRGFPYLPGAHFSPSDPRRAWVIPQFEPRIHFALNCASRSCPPIRAYTAERLDQQLDMAARNFVDQHTRIDIPTGAVYTSAIFKWYQGDFGGKAGVLDLILEHLPPGKRRSWLAAQGKHVYIRYSPYDWGLNQYTQKIETSRSGTERSMAYH